MEYPHGKIIPPPKYRPFIPKKLISNKNLTEKQNIILMGKALLQAFTEIEKLRKRTKVIEKRLSKNNLGRVKYYNG